MRINRRWVLVLVDEPCEIQLVERALKEADVWARISPRGDKLALEIQFAIWKDVRFALKIMKKAAKWPNTVSEGIAAIKARIKEEAQRETQIVAQQTQSRWQVEGNAVVRKTADVSSVIEAAAQAGCSTV